MLMAASWPSNSDAADTKRSTPRPAGRAVDARRKPAQPWVCSSTVTSGAVDSSDFAIWPERRIFLTLTAHASFQWRHRNATHHSTAFGSTRAASAASALAADRAGTVPLRSQPLPDLNKVADMITVEYAPANRRRPIGTMRTSLYTFWRARC
jgi:hypothetical protein